MLRILIGLMCLTLTMSFMLLLILLRYSAKIVILCVNSYLQMDPFLPQYAMNIRGQVHGQIPIPFGVDMSTMGIVVTSGGAALSFVVQPPVEGFMPAPNCASNLLVPYTPVCYSNAMWLLRSLCIL